MESEKESPQPGRAGCDCWQLYWWLTQQVLDSVIPTGALLCGSVVSGGIFKVLCHSLHYNQTKLVLIKLEPMSKFLWGDIKYTKLKDYKRMQKSKGLCCLNNLDEPDSCD